MTDNLGRRYKHQQRERNIRNLQKGIHIAQQYKKWTEKYTRHIQQKIKQRKCSVKSKTRQWKPQTIAK